MQLRIKRLCLYVVLLLSVWLILHIVLIIIDGLNDEIQYADVAVVLGNKVELDGQPSKRLQARLDKAVELYKQGYFPTIIVSGGVGKEGYDEGVVMKEYLVLQGIKGEKISVDSNGYNSYMTAENAAAMRDELKIQSVMVITQYFHISRTKLAFEKVGFNRVYGAHAEIVELRDGYSILREVPAYYKYLFMKKTDG